MDYLARREYGQHELEQKLESAGFDAGIAISVVEQLAFEGLQDERRFVENFIQSRVSQGKGPVRIYADLGQRGVSRGKVDTILEELAVDWFGLAREVRLKKFGRSPPRDFKDRARQMRFLQYRGFQQDQLSAAFNETENHGD